MEDKMLAYEEGKRILSEVSGQGMDIKVETTLESLSEGTQITMLWNGTSKSAFARVILKLMRNSISKQAIAELETFKNLVEKFGIKFPTHD
ncbi:MAG: hypothetical protein ACFFE5_10215 [Candidatus Thorarchaeota archaeon]